MHKIRLHTKSDFIDEAMLPLLGYLTGRRLGLLVHLKGIDIREKYDGVWIAQTSGIVLKENRWTRVPVKNEASSTFFVLHDFLNQIGFVEWAQKKGDNFLFPQLMKKADSSKTASQYMRRLFDRAGIKSSRTESFHSLRAGTISDAREIGIDKRDRKLQVGHQIGTDDHDMYGYKHLTEPVAQKFASLKLHEKVDFSGFEKLDFDKLWLAERTRGRKSK